MMTMRPYRPFARLLVLAALALPSIQPALNARAQTGVSLARGWRHVPMAAAGLRIEDRVQLVAAGPGLVTFTLGPPATPTLWSSVDGQAWKIVRLPTFRTGERVDFHAAGRILVITSHAGGRSRIWVSSDAGATWRQSSAALEITALTTGGDGLVVFSRHNAPTTVSTSVWTSKDGLRWRQLPQARVFASAEVLDVARGGPGLVAGGEAQGRTTIWTSRDGHAWTQTPNTNGIFGTGSFVHQVVAGPRGFLAVGDEMVSQTVAGRTQSAPELVLWASPDGVHWRKGADPFHEPPSTYGRTVPWQGGFIHFSEEAGLSGTFGYGEAAVWSSADGLTWMRVGSDRLFGGTAQVAGAVAFHGGVAAIGSFASHPQPACLRNENQGLNDLRTFHPATFLWSPAGSASAPPPTPDPSDPRALTLTPSDLAAVQRFSSSSFSAGTFGAYVNLCAVDLALGLHRAYSLTFDDPYTRDAAGTSYPGEALSIVTQSARAATAGLRLVDSLFGYGLRPIRHKRELPPRARIGEETRLFQLGLQGGWCCHYPFTQFAVAWRRGPVVGVVEAGTQQEAILLAQRQLAHLGHP